MADSVCKEPPNQTRRCPYCSVASADEEFLWQHISDHLDEEDDPTEEKRPIIKDLNIPPIEKRNHIVKSAVTGTTVKRSDVGKEIATEKLLSDDLVDKIGGLKSNDLDQNKDGDISTDELLDNDMNGKELSTEELLNLHLNVEETSPSEQITKEEISTEKLLSNYLNAKELTTEELLNKDVIGEEISSDQIANDIAEKSSKRKTKKPRKSSLVPEVNVLNQDMVGKKGLDKTSIKKEISSQDMMIGKKRLDKGSFKKEVSNQDTVNASKIKEVSNPPMVDQKSSQKGLGKKRKSVEVTEKPRVDIDQNKATSQPRRNEKAVEVVYMSNPTPDQMKRCVSPQYKCPVCSEMKDDFGGHVSLCHGMVKCGRDKACNMFFQNMEERRNHEEDAHGNENTPTTWKIICGHCKDVKFPDIFTVVEHRHAMHSFHTCTLCSMITTKDEYYQIHMKSHSIRNAKILDFKEGGSLLENLLKYPIATLNQVTMTVACNLCPSGFKGDFDVKSGGEKLWDHFKSAHKVKNPAEALLRLFDGKQFHFQTLLNDKQRLLQLEAEVGQELEETSVKTEINSAKTEVNPVQIKTGGRRKSNIFSNDKIDKLETSPAEIETESDSVDIVEIKRVENKRKRKPNKTISNETVETSPVKTKKEHTPQEIVEITKTLNEIVAKNNQVETKTQRKRTASVDNTEIIPKIPKINKEAILIIKPGTSYTCEICKDEHKDNGDHLCFKHGMVKCGAAKNCNSFFGSFDEKDSHEKEAHVDTFSCMPCKMRFSSVYSQLDHRNSAHSQLTCMFCFVGFKCQEKDNSYFKSHMKTHTIAQSLITENNERNLFEKLLSEPIVDFDEETMTVSCNLCVKTERASSVMSVEEDANQLWEHFKVIHKIKNSHEMLHLFDGYGFSFYNREGSVGPSKKSRIVSAQKVENKPSELKNESNVDTKKRGRASLIDAHPVSKEPTSKKQKGRPSKVTSHETLDNEIEEITLDQVEPEQALDDLYGKAVPAKKRGRRSKVEPKQKVVEEITLDGESSNEQFEPEEVIAAIDNLDESSMPKKKRGRRSKVVPNKNVDDEVTLLDQEQVPDELGEKVVPKKRRGRPSKVVPFKNEQVQPDEMLDDLEANDDLKLQISKLVERQKAFEEQDSQDDVLDNQDIEQEACDTETHQMEPGVQNEEQQAQDTDKEAHDSVQEVQSNEQDAQTVEKETRDMAENAQNIVSEEEGQGSLDVQSEEQEAQDVDEEAQNNEQEAREVQAEDSQYDELLLISQHLEQEARDNEQAAHYIQAENQEAQDINGEFKDNEEDVQVEEQEAQDDELHGADEEQEDQDTEQTLQEEEHNDQEVQGEEEDNEKDTQNAQDKEQVDHDAEQEAQGKDEEAQEEKQEDQEEEQEVQEEDEEAPEEEQEDDV